MKTVGALLILSAALITGLEGLRRARLRENTLQSLAASFLILRSEISSGLVTTEEALEAARERSGGRTRDFYSAVLSGMDRLGEKTFAEIWTEAAEELDTVSKEERDAVNEVGSGLGRYDRETVSALLERAESRLGSMLELLEKKRQKEGRLKLILPIAAAALFIILML